MDVHRNRFVACLECCNHQKAGSTNLNYLVQIENQFQIRELKVYLLFDLFVLFLVFVLMLALFLFDLSIVISRLLESFPVLPEEFVGIKFREFRDKIPKIAVKMKERINFKK